MNALGSAPGQLSLSVLPEGPPDINLSLHGQRIERRLKV